MGKYTCQLDPGHTGRHSIKPRSRGKIGGRLVAYGAHCPGCGVAVAEKGELCQGCLDRGVGVNGPLKSIFEAINAPTRPQPAPAYERPDYAGNFPKPPESPEET